MQSSHNNKEPGLLIDNRYKVIHRLGSGGMGIVYLVEDTLKDNISFALKMIKHSIFKKQDVIINFKNEYEVMTRLKHPNLTQVYDFGVYNGQYFIIMEYLDGILLSDWTKKNQMNEDHALSIVVDILRTIEYIHSRGIIYRDLKPANIMLENNAGTVKLLDFGLASLQARQENRIRGTLIYLAPELLEGQVSYSVDIFSSGLVFFELLTGTTFFDIHNAKVKNIVNILKDGDTFRRFKIERLKKIKNKRLAEIIDKMTGHDAKNRYNTASEVIAEINEKGEMFFDYETYLTKQSYVLGNAFADRTDELALLKENVLNNRYNFVVLSGAVGLGKTRLLNEFRNYCKINNYLVFDARCTEGRSNPYNTIIEIMQKMILYSSDSLLSKYKNHIGLLIPDMIKADDDVFLKGDPQFLKDIIIQNISDFILSFCSESRVIICLDDIQWLDHGSMGIINSLLIKCDRHNNLQIYAAINENEVFGGHIIKLLENEKNLKIPINPFDNDAVNEYLRNIFGPQFTHPSLISKMNAIIKRIGGNPLFLGDLIRSLIEKDIIVKDKKYWKITKEISSKNIPSSLVEIVKQKITALFADPVKLKILQILATLRVGPSLRTINAIFKKISLQNFPGKFLMELERAEIIYSIKIKGDIYFRLYNGLLKEQIENTIIDRKGFSLALADVLWSLFSEVPDYFEEIAYQYHQAGRTEKAVEFYLKCAENSKNLYFHEKALKYYDIVISLLDYDIDKKADTLIKKASSLHIIGRLSEARSVLEGLKDLPLKESMLCEIFNKLGDINLTMGNVENAKDYFDKSIKLAEDIKDKKLLMHGFYNMGIFHSRQSRFELAQGFFRKSIALCNKKVDKKEHAMILNSLGDIYFRLSDYEKALKFFEFAKKLAQKTNDKTNISLVMTSIGNVYKYRGDYERALSCFNDSLLIFEEIGYKTGIAIARENMSIIYLNQGDYNKAIECSMINMKISKDTGDRSGFGIANLNLGNVFYSQGNYKKAIECYSVYEDIAREIGDKRGLGIAHVNIGNIYYKLGKLEKALKYYLGFKKYSEDLGDKRSLGIVYGNIGNIYFAQGKIKSSIDCFKKSATIYESIGDRSNLANIIASAGFIYYNEGDKEKAFRSLEKAIKILYELKIRNVFLVNCLLVKSNIFKDMNKIDLAVSANEAALEMAKEIGSGEYVFKCSMQSCSLMAIRDSKSAVNILEGLLSDKLTKEQRAEIYFELYNITKSDYNRKSALKLYVELYEKKPGPDLQRKIEELKSKC